MSSTFCPPGDIAMKEHFQLQTLTQLWMVHNCSPDAQQILHFLHKHYYLEMNQNSLIFCPYPKFVTLH